MRRLRPTASPARTAWEALTAPLPSASAFAHNLSASLTGGARAAAADGDYFRINDLENGMDEGVRSDTTDYDTSPYKLPTPLYGPEPRTKMHEFLGMLGSGIETAAERLARALHDTVEGAEEGLLLSVRDCEREV